MKASTDDLIRHVQSTHKRTAVVRASSTGKSALASTERAAAKDAVVSFPVEGFDMGDISMPSARFE